MECAKDRYLWDVLSNRGSSVKNNMNFYVGVICANIHVTVVSSEVRTSSALITKLSHAAALWLQRHIILLARSNFNVN